MGLLDFLFKKTSYVVADPAELQQRIFDAVAQNNSRELQALCRANLDTIQQHFKAWSKIPKEHLQNPTMIKWYGEGLTSILSCIQIDLGRADIIPKLVDLSDENPLTQWQNRYAEASQLAQQGQLREVVPLLTDVLIDVAKFKGAESLLAKTFGLLGQAHFHLGSTEDALPHLTKALALCEAEQDAEGCGIYLYNQYEVQRYRGEATLAADLAERLAKFHEQTGALKQAQRYARIAPIVRAGEPLLRVVARIHDDVFEIDDVKAVPNCTMKLEYIRNRTELAPATRLNEQGAQLGSSGKFEEALPYFRDAAKADPFAPHSHYELGTTLASLQRFPQAVESMAEAGRLAPGWFNTRSDLWLLQQISLGNVDAEVYPAVRLLEDGNDPPKEKVALAEKILSRAPQVARLHFELGRALSRLDRTTEEDLAYRRGLECDQDADIRSRLLLSLAILPANKAEKTNLLKQVVETDGHLNTTATARILLRMDQ